MSIYNKEDILGVINEEHCDEVLCLCKDCMDRYPIERYPDFITEDLLEELVFVCDECGKCLKPFN